MFAHLTGTILSLDDGRLTLQIQGTGLGMEILVANSTLAEVTVGENTALVIHHHIAEGAQVLYGFLTESDRSMFRKLLKVDGVGWRTALAVLSSLGTEGVLSAIAAGDEKLITQVPGIGKKTAMKMIVELKNELPNLESLATTNKKPVTPPSSKLVSWVREILDSLSWMGYDRKRLERIAEELPSELISTQERTVYLVKNYG